MNLFELYLTNVNHIDKITKPKDYTWLIIAGIVAMPLIVGKIVFEVLLALKG